MGGQVREGVNRKQQNCDVYLNRSATLLAAGRRRGKDRGGGGGGGGVDCISARRLHDGSINHLLDFVKFLF